ncbi:MAG: VCBS repeat-containing protein [Oleiphilaceae bacterium]|jgi:VCBS repeat-containing protein
MAVISSMILNDDQASSIFSPFPIMENKEQTALTDTLSEGVSDDLLTEIQAIQQAMLNEENFDFSTLAPSAAGFSEGTSIDLSNNKSTVSPILLEDPGLLIHYRSDEQNSAMAIDQEFSSPSPNESSTTVSDSILTAINKNNISQIQASVSEDFITQTQGRFETNQIVSTQTLDTQFGSFSSDGSGNWQYNLNNQLSEIQSLSAGNTINDIVNLTTNSGQKIQIAIEINGTNDQAIITGSQQGYVQAAPIENLDSDQPSISGKLNVSDIDSGEARFETNFDIKGSFGVAQINALGEWTYTLNNNADAIQGLRSGEKVLDLFAIKTIDGSKQLIQINIEGVDDKPLLSGNNVAVLDLNSETSTSGSLLINDPDFGQSSFQTLTGIHSSLGYGSAEIDSQGNWTFNLDIEYTNLNSINEDQTRIDSFEVFTMDGTSQMVNIPIKGSNSPFYAQENSTDSSTQSLSLSDLIKEDNPQEDISIALNEGLGSNTNEDAVEITQAHTTIESIETTLHLNSSHDAFQMLNNNLHDISIS